MTSESGRNPAKRLFPDGRHPEVRRMVAGKRGEVSISALTLAEAMFGAKKKRSQRLPLFFRVQAVKPSNMV